MIKIYNMDVLKALKQMSDESVDMQITSPPYWGLRDYGEGTGSIWDGDENCEHEWSEIKDKKHSGTSNEDWEEDMSRGIRGQADWTVISGCCKKCGAWKGQLGLESDFNLFIKHLCDIFDEVKRVLKKDGTCWINLGDTYASARGRTSSIPHTISKKHRGEPIEQNRPDLLGVYQDKCMVCIPERFAIEMINRGWILRNKIIWHKPNHMPTSVKDRFANSWEYLFMFSKSKSYYFDLDAVREPHLHGEGVQFNLRVRDVKRGYAEKSGQYKASKKEVEQYHGQNIINNTKGKNPDDVIRFSSKEGNRSIVQGTKWSPKNRQYNPLGKQPDDFWDITTHGYPEAHFAVFPEKLVERPIKTTPKWICKKCEKPRERITENEFVKTADAQPSKIGDGKRNPEERTDLPANRGYTLHHTKGWTDCGCNAGFRPAVIMDIFAGSGTSLKVARDLHRDAIGIEIKPEYCELIKKRLFGASDQQTLFDKQFEIIK